MNTVSVLSALSVTGFVTSDLTLQWNGSATSVTVALKGGLQYGSRTAARVYTVSLGTDARDAVGNKMATAFSSTFTTLIRNKFPAYASVIASDTLSKASNPCDGSLRIGGWSAGAMLGYLVFDVSSLPPANQMYSIESAYLFGSQTSQTGDFYSSRNVRVTKIQYYPEFYMVIQNYEALADVGVLSTSDTLATVSLDATESFKSDFVANGVTMHMYKLGPGAPTSTVPSGEIYANFNCDGFHLDVTYLTPE
jgi:hypothetical protein